MKNSDLNTQPGNENQSTNKFLEILEFSIPRILGLGDRDAESLTYGCFDRNYWHYKLIDFPNIRFQEAALILALLYKHKSIEKFYQNEKVAALAFGALEFAFSQQNNDGSFNEAYPFERSFCGTAFAGGALAESLLMLGSNRWEQQLIKLGNWLSTHNNPEVANQMVAAANTLYLLYLLTQDKVYRDASYHKIALLLEQKGYARFLPEYGGFDLGYLSISLSHLAALWSYSAENTVSDIAMGVAVLIDDHLDQYGKFDWMTMNRKTQFVYPFGFAVFKKLSVLKKLENGLKENVILNPGWMDDRYCIAFALDYLKTVINLNGCNGC